MDKVVENILSRLEGHLTAVMPTVASEIGALRVALEDADSERRKVRFLEAMELRDTIIRNINEMRSLGFVPSRLERVIADGTLQTLLKSAPVEILGNKATTL